MKTLKVLSCPLRTHPGSGRNLTRSKAEGVKLHYSEQWLLPLQTLLMQVMPVAKSVQANSLRTNGLAINESLTMTTWGIWCYMPLFETS
jgi:hypothetical protein